MIVSVHILEETLGIESLPLDQAFKLIADAGHIYLVLIAGWGQSVERLSSSISQRNVHRLFKVLFGENLIDTVTKVLPFDMGSSLWGLELFANESEFGARKNNLAHIQTDSELGFGNEATP